RCRAAAQRRAAGPAFSNRLLAGVLSRLGGRSDRRHGGSVSASRAGSVRLSHRLLLAGAGARPVESRARLDREMRRGPEGLAQDRSHFPVTSRGWMIAMWTKLSISVTNQGLAAAARRP